MPRHITVKLLQNKDNEKIMKAVREKWHFACREKTVGMRDFSSESTELEGTGTVFLKCWNKRTVNSESSTHWKYTSEVKEKSKYSQIKEYKNFSPADLP